MSSLQIPFKIFLLVRAHKFHKCIKSLFYSRNIVGHGIHFTYWTFYKISFSALRIWLLAAYKKTGEISLLAHGLKVSSWEYLFQFFFAPDTVRWMNSGFSCSFYLRLAGLQTNGMLLVIQLQVIVGQ